MIEASKHLGMVVGQRVIEASHIRVPKPKDVGSYIGDLIKSDSNVSTIVTGMLAEGKSIQARVSPGQLVLYVVAAGAIGTLLAGAVDIGELMQHSEAEIKISPDNP